MAVLVAFDIVFILNPHTCVLTSTCTTQSELISVQSVMNSITPFKNYTIYDSKKLFLEIQVGCAGLALLISLVYIIIYYICKTKFKNQTATATATTSAVKQDNYVDYPAPQPINRPIPAYPVPQYPVPQYPLPQYPLITGQSPYAPPF
ncbi:unnamed protein product [Didymodactylos carnosus]|uniref:Uncharacterized protein n=1 Tax=Didymodactylos carnosus TaxID=1234261 RepID=A0A813PDI9_9BILA|nr:unnamed protein product [Didymodactylos carnosus]CAF0748939.1 unnamed protein product [Didymodactylos carnosus]CAF3526558.1 unnamed protein product [Didymodactylos carnosus]CAF3528164.1 unnamed protein product [Didymodactylos carnosus]